MATIKYFLKGKIISIYIRFREGRNIDLTKNTGFKIRSKYWNNKNGKSKQIASNKDKIDFIDKLNKLENRPLFSY